MSNAGISLIVEPDQDLDPDNDWVSITRSSTTSNNDRPFQELQLDQGPTRKSAYGHPVHCVTALFPCLTAIYIVRPGALQSTRLSPVTDSSPVQLSSNKEFMRVCSSCAKFRIFMECDGTWKPERKGFCKEHAAYASPASRELGVSFTETEENIVAVLKAIAPFERSKTEKLGVRVFDMTGEVSTTIYEHCSGCVKYSDPKATSPDWSPM